MLHPMSANHAPAPTDFDRTTAVTPIPGLPGQFTVDLDPGWSALVGIHGGYMCAIAVRGAESLVTDRVVRTITTSFLRIGKPGPATLTIDEMRKGRSLTTMVAVLSQDEQILNTSRMTLLTNRTGLEWVSTFPADFPTVESCQRFEASEGVRHFSRVEGRLHPTSLPRVGGERALLRGYLRPLEPTPLDGPWLAMAPDWFPPPSFVRVPAPSTAGGVSIDLTTHIHRPGLTLGRDEWLMAHFELGESTGGLGVEHGLLATQDGRLVAESFQTRLTAED